jgi:hypothetical protein
MSITRLQQARQMYAMGQRVGRIAFGGGGSYVSGDNSGQYQGGSGAPGSAESKSSSKSSNTGGGNLGGGGGGQNSDYRQYKPPVTTYTPDTIDNKPVTGDDYRRSRNDYLTGVGVTGLETLYNDGVPTINAPFGLPTPVTTGLNILKPIRDLSLKKNIDYFRGLNQTKYPETLQGYKDYMTNRLAGYTDAAGNTSPNYYMDSQGNYISRDGGDDGIMGVYLEDGQGDIALPDNLNNEDSSLILRYLHDNPNEVVNLQAMGVQDTDEMLQVMLERAKNLYT